MRFADGKKLVMADFSAIEMRIMAYLSGDETSHYFHNCVQGFFEMPLTALSQLLAGGVCGPDLVEGIKASKFQVFNTALPRDRCRSHEKALYRLKIAKGFLEESSQDVQLQRWH